MSTTNKTQIKRNNKHYLFHSMNDFELGFIVGLIEGEGTITMSKSRFSTPQGFALWSRLFITNTDIRLLKKAQSIIGGQIQKRKNQKNQTIDKVTN